MSPLALITGASRGIGRGIALELAREGRHDLVINYAGNEAAARECKALCDEATGGKRRVEIVRADVSLPADRERMLDFVFREFGRLDLLVNNAGVAPSVRADLLEASEESFDRLIGINLKGPYFLTQKAAKLIIDTTPADGIARAIVNVSSISAYTVSTNRGEYCVAKAGIAMMTQCMAREWGRHGINTNAICPGYIRTEIAGDFWETEAGAKLVAGLPRRRLGEPRDLDALLLLLCSGEASRFINGSAITVDDGMTSW